MIREKLIEQVLRRSEGHHGGASIRIASDLEKDEEAKERSVEVRAALARAQRRQIAKDEAEQRELDRERKGKRIARKR